MSGNLAPRVRRCRYQALGHWQPSAWLGASGASRRCPGYAAGRDSYACRAYARTVVTGRQLADTIGVILHCSQ
jgi:hypothetical protein